MSITPHAESLAPYVEKRTENLALHAEKLAAPHTKKLAENLVPHAEKFAPHEIFWVW